MSVRSTTTNAATATTAAARVKGWELAAAIARRYRAVHTGLGIMGNAAFLVGSVLFLFESVKVVGIWLFIVGAAGMLTGSVGSALVDWKSDSS